MSKISRITWLAKLVDPVEDAVVLAPSAIDLDKEFGLKDD